MTLFEPWNAVKVALSLHTHALHAAALLRIVLGQHRNKPGLANENQLEQRTAIPAEANLNQLTPSQPHLTQVHSELAKNRNCPSEPSPQCQFRNL